MTLSGLSSAPVVARFPIGLVAAVAALLVMDQAMARLPEGATPPRVAAGVLTRTHPDDAPARLAAVAHYAAGLGTGLLFVYFSLLAETLLGGASALSVAATTLVLYVLMVAFFVVVPLPRAPGLDQARRRGTARDWAASAAVYLTALVPAVIGLTLATA